MKRAHDKLTAMRLREVLSYDPVTGLFRWLMKRGRVKAGAITGSAREDGYREICVDECRYRANRLAWLYVKGRWPEGQVDHKNTVHGDDRFENLREVSRSVNQQNRRRAQRNNKSGFLEPRVG